MENADDEGYVYIGTIQGAEEAQEDCQDSMATDLRRHLYLPVYVYVYIYRILFEPIHVSDSPRSNKHASCLAQYNV